MRMFKDFFLIILVATLVSANYKKRCDDDHTTTPKPSTSTDKLVNSSSNNTEESTTEITSTTTKPNTKTTTTPLSTSPSTTSTTEQPKSNCCEDENYEDDCCDKPFIYKCNNNEWLPYLLDDAPAREGVYYGDYGVGNPGFVGSSSVVGERGTSRIQIIDPKGSYQVYGGHEEFINDTNRMWYLKKNCNHQYTWLNVSSSKIVPYAVQTFAENANGFPMYVGRKVINNYTVAAGISVPFMGVMYWANTAGNMFQEHYGEVLICKSNVFEPPAPSPPNTSNNTNETAPPGTKCVLEWKKLDSTNDPNKDGLSAGLYDVNNKAFVGKAQINSFWRPGRVQTVEPSGFYGSSFGSAVYVDDEVYYLYKNPKYTYSWIDTFGDNLLSNAVTIKPDDQGLMFFCIGRIQLDGHMRVAQVVLPVGMGHARLDGLEHFVTNFQMLTCDPEPSNPCKQVWMPYNNDEAPSVDGIDVGFYNNGQKSYVGRTVNKYIKGSDEVIGRVQINPKNESGVYTLHSVTGGEHFNPYTGEYLQKNANDIYKWVNSHTGDHVENALKVKISDEGLFPCNTQTHTGFIGRVFVDNVAHVGTVYSESGLNFFDFNGRKSVVSSYQVLTCKSPEIYEGDDDSDEFGSREDDTH